MCLILGILAYSASKIAKINKKCDIALFFSHLKKNKSYIFEHDLLFSLLLVKVEVEKFESSSSASSAEISEVSTFISDFFFFALEAGSACCDNCSLRSRLTSFLLLHVVSPLANSIFSGVSTNCGSFKYGKQIMARYQCEFLLIGTIRKSFLNKLTLRVQFLTRECRISAALFDFLISNFYFLLKKRFFSTKKLKTNLKPAFSLLFILLFVVRH